MKHGVRHSGTSLNTSEPTRPLGPVSGHDTTLSCSCHGTRHPWRTRCGTSLRVTSTRHSPPALSCPVTPLRVSGHPTPETHSKTLGTLSRPSKVPILSRLHVGFFKEPSSHLRPNLSGPRPSRTVESISPPDEGNETDSLETSRSTGPPKKVATFAGPDA